MVRMFALLIGIDCYMKNTGLAGLNFGNLGGCVRDINMVEAYLQTLPKKPDRILKLTASGAGSEPQERDKKLWPTYQNMVQAFKDVTTEASEDDLVYVHYSGHGVRTNTVHAKIKGGGYFWDEGLVPTDYGQPDGNYLLDLPMAQLIQEMLDKKLCVTFVLDSCHSGGAMRGESASSAVPRGIPNAIDPTPPDADSLVATPEQLASLWQKLTKGGSRSVTNISGWMVQPRGYTVLAACRSNELAYEDYFDPSNKVKNGAFTYWLLDSLRALGTNVSYKRLHDRIMAKVRNWQEAQTPQLHGEGDLIIFGKERATSHFAIPVLSYDAALRQVTLNAGEVHGLIVGSQLAIYPAADNNLASQEGRLALVEVSEFLTESDSIAKVIEPAGEVKVESGHQAILLGSSYLRLHRTVQFVNKALPGHQSIENAIQNGGAGFIRMSNEGEKVEFLIDENEKGDTYDLLDGSGALLMTKDPIKIGSPNTAERIVKRLVHFAKFRNVQALDNPNSSFANKLRLKADGPIPNPDGPGLLVVPGQQFTLHIFNDLPRDPNRPNDLLNTLNVTILDLQSNWEITQIFPANDTDSDIVSPGDSLPIQLEMTLPEGYEECHEILKVFVTRRTTKFQWLTLPPLDEEAKPKSAMRGDSSDPLDQLLEAVSEERLSDETLTRAVRVVQLTTQSKPWLVAQVEIHIKKA